MNWRYLRVLCSDSNDFSYLQKEKLTKIVLFIAKGRPQSWPGMGLWQDILCYRYNNDICDVRVAILKDSVFHRMKKWWKLPLLWQEYLLPCLGWVASPFLVQYKQYFATFIHQENQDCVCCSFISFHTSLCPLYWRIFHQLHPKINFLPRDLAQIYQDSL